MKSIHILLADDHAVVRGGLKHLLSARYPDATFLECARGADVMDTLASSPCDLVVMDISLPDIHGLEVLKQLKSSFPQLPVIMLTVFKEEHYAARAFQWGASAYLQKAGDNEELLLAAETALQGQRYLPPSMTEKLRDSLTGEKGSGGLASLSEREHSIFLLIATGKSLKEIAAQLGLSPKTVTTYRSRILEKLSLDSNAALVQFAVKNGLIE